MTRTELLRTARNIGVRNTKTELLAAIAARRAYLARPAADIPKTPKPDVH